MSEEDNKQLVLKWVALLNEKRLGDFFDVWSTNFVLRAGPGLGEARSMRELETLVARFAVACPDLTVELKDIATAGDLVHVRAISTGTHTGPYMGVPPTGKRLSMWTMGVFRIEDGKIAEEWVIDDYASVLAQLDALPG